MLSTSAAVEAGSRWGSQSADGGFCAQHDQDEQTRNRGPARSLMRIAGGDSLCSTPPNFRRRGDGAQRGGTEDVVVDGSSVAVRF